MSKVIYFLSAILLFSVARAVPQPPRGWIVSLSPNGVLEAHSLNSKTHKRLRNFVSGFEFYGAEWDISPNGKRLAFAGIPVDVDFFSAQSTRLYLFEQRWSEKNARPLILAYKEKDSSVFSIEGHDIGGANWDFQGSNLVVTHANGSYGNTNPATVLLFDPSKRQAKPLIDVSRLYKKIRSHAQTQVVINRAKTKIVYVGVSPASQNNDFYGETDWNYTLIVYELKSKKVRILATSSIGISRPRISPNGNFCVFVDSTKADEKAPSQGRIFQANLKTGALKQLTRPQNETDNWPDWSPDGRFIVWQRENLGEQDPQKRFKLCLMKADGGGQKPVRTGYPNTGLRWIAALPNWSRFAKFPIEARVYPGKK